MATRSYARPKTAPAHDTFFVVKHGGLASAPDVVTVLHEVPKDAEELAAFENPSRAIDFAEMAVRDRRAAGFAIELVDPPYGLVGTG
jgi:hypothetical protein